MHKVRDFRLVFCADIFNCEAKGSMIMLERFVKKEKERGGLGYFLHEPLVISGRRTARTRPPNYNTGWQVDMPICSSAL